MSEMFENAKNYCVEAYGVPVEVDEETSVVIGFVCPTCGEFIYSEDWSDEETENWLKCPICEEYFSDVE